MQPCPVTGRDLYEVFHLDNTTERNELAWTVLSRRHRIDHEMAAQALNVRLGLIPATRRSYLFAFETVTPVDDLTGLLTCIQTHIQPFDRFEVYAIENGREVGYGWYERGTIAGGLITWECSGRAEELATVLHEQYRARTLQAGGHA